MIHRTRISVVLALLLTAFTIPGFGADAVPGAKKKPLKVFILAGQSNMEGHARIETFDYIGDDPATAPLLQKMRGDDGQPRVCDHVWISYYTGKYDGSANGEGTGKLTAGFGARDEATKSNGKIGPEFTFGLTLDAAIEEPVLIIKTAWGGRSLHTEFRPPSAGPYELNDYQKKLYYGPPGHGIPKDMNQWLAEKKQETGRFYRYMVEHVKRVLADPQRVCPAYDPAAGYEIAGFIWLQGFNDLVDHHTYPEVPKGTTTNRFAKYSEVLGHFIRDVRKDLNAPQMPFVIGVLGVGGVNANKDILAFREAMTAPALLPEFKGNVTAVPTAPFWSEELSAIEEKYGKVRQMDYYLNSKHKDYANAAGQMTDQEKREYLKKFEADLITPAEVKLWKRGASNAGYHYLGCAKTFALMGKHFAEANLEMLRAPPGAPPAPQAGTR
ncbi:MAG: sialate O-acetylesterase [Planctomycetota bacterium]